jgi:hypothetical protein
VRERNEALIANPRYAKLQAQLEQALEAVVEARDLLKADGFEEDSSSWGEQPDAEELSKWHVWEEILQVLEPPTEDSRAAVQVLVQFAAQNMTLPASFVSENLQPTLADCPDLRSYTAADVRAMYARRASRAARQANPSTAGGSSDNAGSMLLQLHISTVLEAKHNLAKAWAALRCFTLRATLKSLEPLTASELRARLGTSTITVRLLDGNTQ